MRPRLAFATGNAHKVAEFEAILRGSVEGLDIPAGSIVTLKDVGAPEPVEDGVSFEENALIKARALCGFTGLPSVADDSGITVDILGGAPGIFSARWCGSHGDDAANLQLLLNQLRDVPDQHRGAQFVCAAAVVFPDGREVVRTGKLPGVLLHEARGNAGFGYDPIFVADGYSVTNAELSAEEKNAISHRGQALRALVPVFAEIFSC